MQYLNEQIYDQAGIVVNDNFGVTEEILDDLATQGVRIVVNRVQVYNPDKLSFFSDETEVTDSSGKTFTELTSDIVLGCERVRGDYKYSCTKVPWQLFEKSKNPNTIFYRTKYDPIYSTKNGSVYILPNPNASESGWINHVKLVDIDVSTVADINAMAGQKFPLQLDQAVIKWVVMQLKMRMLDKLLDLAQDEFSSITGTATLASEAFTSQTSFTFTHSIGTIPAIIILDSDGKEIGGELDHAADFLSVAVTFAVAQSGTIYAVSGTASGGDLANFVSTLPTWTSPTVPSMPTPITPGNIEAMVKELPTYAALSFSGTTVPTSPTLPTAITVGTVVAPQSAPEPANVDFTGIATPALTSQLATSVPSISSLTNAVAGLDSDRIVKALDNASGWIYTQNNAGSGAGVTIDTFAKITSHDVALANEATKAAGAYTQTASQEIAHEVAKMQSVSEDIKHVIGEFNGNISAYQTRVNGAIAEYQAEIADYNADIQKMIGQFNAESKSDIDKFSADAQHEVSVYKSETDAEIASYGAESSALVSKYNADVQSYIAELKRIIDTYQAQNKLQIDLFVAELSERIQQYNAETGADIKAYQAEVQAVLGEYGALVNKMTQEYSAGISKANAYLQSANIRLQTGRAYTEQAGVLPNEIIKLDAQFENEVRLFCGVQPAQQQDDRR